MSCRIVSYRIVSYHIESCRVVSCRIVSYRIVLCRIVSFRILSSSSPAFKSLTPIAGWENRVTAPLNTETVFSAGSPHRVIAPNKVVQLKQDSIVLEHPFEGKNEVPFFVSAYVRQWLDGVRPWDSRFEVTNTPKAPEALETLETFDTSSWRLSRRDCEVRRDVGIARDFQTRYHPCSGARLPA
jgi:hypothetical protein